LNAIGAVRDGGSILVRELDERLGLSELVERHLRDSRSELQTARPETPSRIGQMGLVIISIKYCKMLSKAENNDLGNALASILL
jgi:hypothetical protein